MSTTGKFANAGTGKVHGGTGAFARPVEQSSTAFPLPGAPSLRAFCAKPALSLSKGVGFHQRLRRGLSFVSRSLP